MRRFQTSMSRLGMDTSYDPQDLLDCITTYIKMEKHWIPKEFGQSLYIRPWAMSLHDHLDLVLPQKYVIYCALSPVGAYFGDKISPINIYMDTRLDRGSARSAYSYKLGSNYSPYVKPQKEITTSGWHNILWTHSGVVSEINGCNMMFVVQNGPDEIEIITPELDGSILPGITRKSILELLNSNNPINPKTGKPMWNKVTERILPVVELVEMLDQGKVIEIFGCGTAVVVVPLKVLGYGMNIYKFNIEDYGSGPVCNWIYQKI